VTVPPGWFVTDWGTLILTSYDMSQAPGRGGVPPGFTKIDVYDAPLEEGTSLDAWLEALFEQDGMCPASQMVTLWQSDWSLATGERAIRYQRLDCFGDETAGLAAVIGTTVVHMANYGDAAPFDAVAASLRRAAP
jgi:hypothetical protein